MWNGLAAYLIWIYCFCLYGLSPDPTVRDAYWSGN